MRDIKGDTRSFDYGACKVERTFLDFNCDPLSSTAAVADGRREFGLQGRYAL